MSIVNLVEWWNQNENVDAKSKIGNLWRTDENAWFSWRENLTLTNRFRKWLFRWLVKKTIWKIWKHFVQLRWCSCWAGKTYQHTTNCTRSMNLTTRTTSTTFWLANSTIKWVHFSRNSVRCIMLITTIMVRPLRSASSNTEVPTNWLLCVRPLPVPFFVIYIIRKIW